MEVMQVLHMNKGKGETSYSNNSAVQRKIISIADSIIEKALADILIKNFPESLDIADLGCSSGPNALTVISHIMDIVSAIARLSAHPPPELRMCLNDLPSNDFNDIFLSLPAFYNKLKQEKGAGFQHCFVSGVPGSFYGRLFPKKSLQFVHSSSSLHWLSQVPAALESKVGPHLNKGKIYISETSSPCVLKAYLRQFQKDFSLFLRSRSEEIVSGGRMVLSFMGRRSADPSSKESCYQWELLARALTSMAAEGLAEEVMIDSFNAPYYAPSKEEVTAEVENEGSFIVDQLESFEIEWDGGDQSNFASSEMGILSRGQRVAKTIRAVVESMLEFHFGRDIMDELFVRYSELVDDYLSKSRAHYIDLVISLIKKG